MIARGGGDCCAIKDNINQIGCLVFVGADRSPILGSLQTIILFDNEDGCGIWGRGRRCCSVSKTDG